MAEKVCCLVYSFINDEAYFLVLHRNGWWKGWELIRGDINEDEGAFNAALRVVNEKTGLNINEVDAAPYNYSYDYLKGVETKNAEVSCFAAKSCEQIISLSNEHDFFKWVDYETALKLLDFKEQKEFISRLKGFIK